MLYIEEIIQREAEEAMGHHSCCNQQKVKRGLWSPEEDEKLIRYNNTHGYCRWSEVPEKAGLQRCGKSCRLRWINYLRPDIRRGRFTPDEEKLIIKLHDIVGNRWAHIASHWNSWIKKKIRQPASIPPAAKSPPTSIADLVQSSYNSTDQLDVIMNQNFTANPYIDHAVFPTYCPFFMFDTGTDDNRGGSRLTEELVQEALALNTDIWNVYNHNQQDHDLSSLLTFTSSAGSDYLPPLVDGMVDMVSMHETHAQPSCVGDDGLISTEYFERQELIEWGETQHYSGLLTWERVQTQIGGDHGLPSAQSSMVRMDTKVSLFP